MILTTGGHQMLIKDADEFPCHPRSPGYTIPRPGALSTQI